MSKALKTTFGVHALISLILGLPLLLAPGRFLGLFGWFPIDPLITRLFGGALLAFAWGSFQGYKKSESDLHTTLIQFELIFTTAGMVGLLRHLLVAWYPWYVWVIFFILTIFAALWLFFLLKRR